MTVEKKKYLSDRIEFYRKWVITLSIPIFTFAVTSLVAKVKSETIDEVRKEFVSIEKLAIVQSNVKDLMENQKIDSLKISEGHSDLAVMNKSLENINKLLEEVRVDLKSLIRQKNVAGNP